jgi:hypothetical protein
MNRAPAPRKSTNRFGEPHNAKSPDNLGLNIAQDLVQKSRVDHLLKEPKGASI